MCSNLLKIKQVAQRMRCCPKTVRNHIKNGVFSAEQFGGIWYIYCDEDGNPIVKGTDFPSTDWRHREPEHQQTLMDWIDSLPKSPLKTWTMEYRGKLRMLLQEMEPTIEQQEAALADMKREIEREEAQRIDRELSQDAMKEYLKLSGFEKMAVDHRWNLEKSIARAAGRRHAPFHSVFKKVA